MSGIEIFLFAVVGTLLAMACCASVSAQPQSIAAISLQWFLSWLGQSFAPQLGIVAMVIVAIAWSGDLSRVIMLASLVSAWLFFRVHIRGGKTVAVIDAVVDNAVLQLGSKVQNIGSGKPSLLTGFRPFNFGGSNVVCHKNISYGDGGQANCLNIYQPRVKPDKPMPVLIQVPGGAWVTGNKDQQAMPLLHHMAAQGWTCFAINYRLAPDFRFPAMMEDVLRAIAWVKANAASYGADPDFVAITGGSAGGHLLSLAALLRDRAQFQPGFEDADTQVSVAVPFYGRYDFLNRHQLLPGTGLEPFLTAKVMPGSPSECHDLWELASPEAQVHADAPPFLVIHGSGDAMIPAAEARAFTEALQSVSTQAVDYAELPGAQHAFDMVCSSWAMPTINAVARYLDAHYARYLGAVKK